MNGRYAASPLLRGHAAFHRALDWTDSFRFVPALQQMYSEVAGVLFDANLLTVELLENGLRVLMVEAAIAGGWIWFVGAAEQAQRTEIFPGYLGNVEAWERLDRSLPLLFSAEIAEWRSKLLDRAVESGAVSNATAERVSPRELLKSYLANFPDEKINAVIFAGLLDSIIENGHDGLPENSKTDRHQTLPSGEC
jgi:hypothetical protein